MKKAVVSICRIRSFWQETRPRVTAHFASNFAALHLNANRLRSITFRETLGLIRDQGTIQCTKAFFQRLVRLSGQKAPVVRSFVNTRVILTAVLIRHFPGQVFENVGPLEHTLVAQATRMLQLVEAGLPHLTADGAHRSRIIAAEIRTALEAFAQTFEDWRAGDVVRLGARLAQALRDLHVHGNGEGFADLPHDDPTWAEMREAVTKIRRRLRQIQPEALVALDAEMAAQYGW